MKAYLSLIKFAHTVFALPFALLSFFLAISETGSTTVFPWRLLGLILLCMVFARSAAMAFNRYTDRRIDAANARTVIREIPSGVISPTSALWFVILMSVAFMATTWFINPLCFYLSPVALLVILGYSYTKRFTWLCHLVLGIGLGLAPVGAWIAVTGSFDLLPILYGFMVMFWVSGFDVLYALQDETFDREHGLHSIPGRFGQQKAKKIAAGLHMACAVLLVVITCMQDTRFDHFGMLHWLGAGGFLLLIIRQHWLVYRYHLARIDKAFFETNGIASVMFGAAVILDLLI